MTKCRSCLTKCTTDQRVIQEIVPCLARILQHCRCMLLLECWSLFTLLQMATSHSLTVGFYFPLTAFGCRYRNRRMRNTCLLTKSGCMIQTAVLGLCTVHLSLLCQYALCCTHSFSLPFKALNTLLPQIIPTIDCLLYPLDSAAKHSVIISTAKQCLMHPHQTHRAVVLVDQPCR